MTHLCKRLKYFLNIWFDLDWFCFTSFQWTKSLEIIIGKVGSFPSKVEKSENFKKEY